MNAILGMSDMLAESNLDPEQMQYVEVFRRAGANLLVLINDILDLSKIEAGHLELEHVDFDLEELVDQAIELIGVKTRAKGIVLLSHLAPGLVTALAGDPRRLLGRHPLHGRLRKCDRRSSRVVLPTNLPPFSGSLQLQIPLGMDLRLTPGEHVLRRDVANRVVQANLVVMLDVVLHQTPRCTVCI
jgi:hypothetical protein